MLQNLMTVEENILLWIQNNVRNEWLTSFFTFITFLGNKGLIWILVSIILLFPQKTRKTGVKSLIALCISALIINMLLKNIVVRTRPYDVIHGLTSLIGIQKDYSFPSGHTGSSFAVAVILFRELPKRFGIPILIFAFLMGFSRMYVGVHYPSDIISGALIGTVIALFVSCLKLSFFDRNV